MVYIYLPELLVRLAKPQWLSMYNTEKMVPKSFVTYTHSSIIFGDLHTLFLKSLCLNNVTYVCPTFF